MNPVGLIVRILSGERMERGSRENTAWWLSCLATLPLLILLFVGAMQWVRKSGWLHLVDTLPGLVGMILVVGIGWIALQLVIVRIFKRSPLGLLPFAVLAWAVLARVLWT
jgi:hypothetical protein